MNSSDYQAEFDAETLSGNSIAADIAASVITVFNMSWEFAGMTSDVDGLKAQVETTYQSIVDAAKLNTVYLDADSLSSLADMSIMVSAISIALEGQALVAQGLAPLTRDTTLSDSMNSMLSLSSDLGIMADRILEMADLILAMADNIGLTADQIIAMQTLQSTDYAATLASVEAIQDIAVSVIALYSL